MLKRVPLLLTLCAAISAGATAFDAVGTVTGDQAPGVLIDGGDVPSAAPFQDPASANDPVDVIQLSI